MNSIENFLKDIKIYDCGLSKVRIGNKSDGGYITLHEINKNCSTLCSFGVEDNVTFELDFVDKYSDCSVKLFDHTVKSLPQEHPNFTFFKKGVGPKTFDNFISLSEIISECEDNITLKMDIEWDEWKTLESLSDKELKKIDQLIVEFHIVGIDVEEKFILSKDPDTMLTPYFSSFYKSVYEKLTFDIFQHYSEVMKKINGHFYAFHIHPNNSLRKVEIGGFIFPPLLEICFVRKDLIQDVKLSKEEYPIEGLDYPNKPYKEELKDYYPLVKKK